MGAQHQITSPAPVQCADCKTNNPTEAKFCRGCGHALHESCFACNQPVLLTQNFCVSCGGNLDENLRRKHSQHQNWLSSAVSAVKECDFELSLSLFRRVAEVDDYRFRDAAATAKKAIIQVEALQRKSLDSTERTVASAKAAMEQGNKHEVVRLLKTISPKLIDSESRKLLSQTEAYLNQILSLDGRFQQAIASKNWALAGGMVNQLLQLEPLQKDYQVAAGQITSRLIADARQMLANRDYSRAIKILDSVPDGRLSKENQQLRDRVDDIRWLSNQFDGEPFATPTLGKLGVRLTKEVPEDSQAHAMVKQIVGHLKQSPRPERMHVPSWKADNDSWIGGRAGLLAVPTKLDLGNHPMMKMSPGRFNVAVGLALQGLGRARVKEHFGSSKKKGVLQTLGRRKVSGCWGIDIGTASLKAVYLKKKEAHFVVADCYIQDFESPLCRAGNEENSQRLIHSAVEKLKEEKEFGDAKIWANLQASQLTNRFVRLPPVADKKVAKLLAAEIEQRIPIPVDELVTVKVVGELHEDKSHGRAAFASAARSREVEHRLELLRDVGLEVDGLQADPIALVNFAALEFDELLSDAPEQAIVERNTTPAVALVDSGAMSTTLLIVSGETHWFWTIETGGEELTRLLAKATKTTHADAEKMKRNPALIPCPAHQYAPLEQRMDEVLARLKRVQSDALRQNPCFDISESWCMGGGCLTHQWIRRVMLANDAQT